MYRCTVVLLYHRARFCHDLVVDSEMLSVFKNGSAPDLRADHHKMSPYGTLWTDLDAGEGRRLFKGGVDVGVDYEEGGSWLGLSVMLSRPSSA